MLNREQLEIDARILEEIGTPETDQEINLAITKIQNVDPEKASRLMKDFRDNIYHAAKDLANHKREVLKATA